MKSAVPLQSLLNRVALFGVQKSPETFKNPLSPSLETRENLRIGTVDCLEGC